MPSTRGRKVAGDARPKPFSEILAILDDNGPRSVQPTHPSAPAIVLIWIAGSSRIGRRLANLLTAFWTVIRAFHPRDAKLVMGVPFFLTQILSGLVTRILSPCFDCLLVASKKR